MAKRPEQSVPCAASGRLGRAPVRRARRGSSVRVVWHPDGGLWVLAELVVGLWTLWIKSQRRLTEARV